MGAEDASIEQRDELRYRNVSGSQDTAQRAAVEFPVQRHSDRPATCTRQADVASLLPDELVADLGERSDTRPARNHRQPSHESGGDLDVDHAVLRRQLPAFLWRSLQAKLDGLANVGQSLVAGATLADAARDQRALGDDPAILSRRKHHGKLHHESLRHP